MNDTLKKIKEQVEKNIEEIANQNVNPENTERLYKLIDIHKDIVNEEYWKEDIMRYRNYSANNYNAGGNYGNEYGRERYGTYGRRGVDAKYRGEEIMDNMYQAYEEYNDDMNSYGADQKTMESFKYMVKSFKDYYKHLKQNASSQEEVRILEDAINEMANM